MSFRSFSRAGITRRLFNTPLAVLPSTAAIVLGAVGPRFDVSQLLMHAGETLAIEELVGRATDERAAIEARTTADVRRGDLSASQVLHVEDGVAHIDVRGELVAENGGGVTPASGFTGYDAILAAWGFAQRDPQVRGILVDVDSPGGEVDDLNELVAAMMADRGKKPSRAVIRGVGASAAYAIAAACDEVTVQDLGFAGSIGVICMHADFSAQLAKDGVKVTLIHAGAHKADGNPFEALPDAVRSDFQARIDRAYGRFVEHVAAARGMDEAAVRATEAQVYQGQAAVDVGLADRVMSWRDAQADFAAKTNGRKASVGRAAGTKPAAGAAAGVSTEQDMTDLSAAFAGITNIAIEGSTEQAATLAAALAGAGVAGVTVGVAATASREPIDLDGARAEAAAAERGRITALADLCPETTISTSLKTAIDEGKDAGAFAVGLAQTAKARGASLADLRAGAVQPNQVPAGASGAALKGTAGDQPKGLLARAAALGHRGLGHLTTAG